MNRWIEDSPVGTVFSRIVTIAGSRSILVNFTSIDANFSASGNSCLRNSTSRVKEGETNNVPRTCWENESVPKVECPCHCILLRGVCQLKTQKYPGWRADPSRSR